MDDSAQEKQGLGERLAKTRGDVSQEQFAQLLGIGRASLQRYEAGERSIDSDLMAKLWVLFRVDPLWLLTGVASTDAVWGNTAAENEAVNLLRQLDCRSRESVVELLRAFTQRLSGLDGPRRDGS